MAKFKVLKTGETDIDSTDIWRFTYHSDYSTFKISSSGSQDITITASGTEAYHDINHNLGYNPMFFASVVYAGKSYPVFGYGQSGGIKGILDVFDDETVIVLYANNNINTLRIGVMSVPFGVKNNTTFTVNWIIMLDEI